MRHGYASTELAGKFVEYSVQYWLIMNLKMLSPPLCCFLKIRGELCQNLLNSHLIKLNANAILLITFPAPKHN